MKKLLVGAALLALSGQASAITVELVAHNQRSSSGTLNTLIWNGANGLTPSNAVWNWDPGTGVLSMTGTFWTTSHLGSDPFGPSVIGDKVTGMTINTVAGTTTAASYECVEGTFLANVGAHGCSNLNIGFGPGAYQSSMAYNVGGNANCVVRTIGGNDVSTGNPRGLSSLGAAGGCDATDGAFNLYTVVSYTGAGGELILSNGIATGSAGTNYLTFHVVPVPAAVWLLGSALGGLAWVRRRARA
ncbi:MAG: VPLPA-CTERM sorting domain-containing protein [Gammaproteobacteria bacterium]|nr:VPLPA-CTERM sorting domain-containing protein [Gammaproteobacteria bacterium]